MYRLGEPATEEQGNSTNVNGVFAEQKESLYWTALMITGDAESARQCIIDATGLAQNADGAFRDWLTEWAHVATARQALKTVRLPIREAADQRRETSCSHRKHAPFSPAEVRLLHEVNARGVAERLDVLARAVLVLYGCRRLSFTDCTLLLNAPLQCVVDGFCRARQWFQDSVAPTESLRHSASTRLHALRNDPDGVPVWG